MGYTTNFSGYLTIDPPLNAETVEYINSFCNTRRMKRDVSKLASLDILGNMGKFGTNEYGTDGEFYVNDDNNCGQTQDASVVEYNSPPSTQPGLWCQWEISEDGDTLMWSGGEKFYYYVEWLRYVINNFIAPMGSICDGDIMWQGEELDDVGMIRVVNNDVKSTVATFDFGE